MTAVRRVAYTQSGMTQAERALVEIERLALDLVDTVVTAEFTRDPTCQDVRDFTAAMLRQVVSACQLKRTLLERAHNTVH